MSTNVQVNSRWEGSGVHECAQGGARARARARKPQILTSASIKAPVRSSDEDRSVGMSELIMGKPRGSKRQQAGNGRMAAHNSP